MSVDAWGSAQVELADPAQAPLLARGTVDRQSGVRSDAGWLDTAWRERGRLLRVTAEGGARIDFDTESLVWEAVGGERPAEVWFLGADAEAAYFAQVVASLPGARSLRELGARLADIDSGLLTAAVGLANWHAVNTHCPRDGSPTVVESAGWVRVCPVDGSHHFPRTDPAVIMLITNPAGTAAVLGRQAVWPARRFSCLAGFVEPGESAEQAVVREVAEEAGIVVREVRAMASQPWPFPASLMLGFRAVADDADVPISVDGELEEVAWFHRDEIAAGAVLLPPPASIANWLIAGWLAEPQP